MRRSLRDSRGWMATRSSSTPISLRRPRPLVGRLADAGLALVEAADGTTNALSLPDPSVFAPLYGPGSADRFRAHAPFATVAIPELGARRRLRRGSRAPHGCRARAADARAPRRSAREGRPALRRRRRRALRARPRRRPRARRAHGHRQRRRRRRDPRPPRLARPRQPPLHARRAHRRRARLGASRRDLERARVGGELRWGGLVPARRPRPRAPPRAHAARCATALRCPRSPRRFAARAGVGPRILPATDDRLRTHVRHAGREIPVPGVVRRPPASRRRRRRGVRGRGRGRARRRESWLHSTQPTSILLAPSNPYLSIGPILAVAAIRDAIERRRARCVAVSPLVGGAAVTGPAARMLTRMAGGATPRHVADRYKGLIDALVIDESDAPADADVELVVTHDAHARSRRPSAGSPRSSWSAACA